MPKSCSSQTVYHESEFYKKNFTPHYKFYVVERRKIDEIVVVRKSFAYVVNDKRPFFEIWYSYDPFWFHRHQNIHSFLNQETNSTTWILSKLKQHSLNLKIAGKNTLSSTCSKLPVLNINFSVFNNLLICFSFKPISPFLKSCSENRAGICHHNKRWDFPQEATKQ